MSAKILEQLSEDSCKLTRRVELLRDAYFKAMPEVCAERPELVTEFYLENGLFNQDHISILDKARLYRYVLGNRKAIIFNRKAYQRQENGREPKAFEFTDDNLFAGSTTSKFKGVPIYPEFAIALALWPELWSMSTRKNNPFQLSKSEAVKLNREIFPHWMKSNVMEIARERCFKENFEKYGVKKSAPALELFNQLVFFIPSKAGCISHTIPYLSRAIDEGLRAIINDAKMREAETSDSSKKEFYQAVAEALEGIIEYSNNLADEAEKLAKKEKDSRLKQELLEIAEINRRVPEHPAQTFREGLTTVWMCWVAIHTENRNFAISTGRMDQYLYSLYKKDIDSGKIAPQDAVDMLCCLWLKIGDHVPTIADAGEQLFGGTGSNQAITIGGVDTDGQNAVNDLTYVILRSIELMKLRDPNLNARYYPGVSSEDEDYLEELCRVNIKTGATPALHNDRAVINALMSRGETLEQARDYGIVGCVEPGSSGRTYGHSAAILLNLTSVLELALFNGKHRHTRDTQISEKTGSPGDFGTIDDFKAAFKKQVEWMINLTTDLNNRLGKVYQDFQPTPILSALFEGPMEKGKSLEQGGAIINSSGVTIIGFADVADSLTAIQEVILSEENEETFEDMIEAISHNFEGEEKYRVLHKKLLEAPKYGTGSEIADSNAEWVADLLDKTCAAKKNYRDGDYRVGYWTMTNHAGFGRLMGASPSGRKKGENFASGITPVSRSVYGLDGALSLTDTLSSVAGLPASSLSSGIAFNLKYVPHDGTDEEMLDNFATYVRTFFGEINGETEEDHDGGMEIQFNVTDHKEFIAAVSDPAKYDQLLVRVSGYTAYFKDLNPQMQKEIIDRTEYRLSKNSMVYYEPYKLS